MKTTHHSIAGPVEADLIRRFQSGDRAAGNALLIAHEGMIGNVIGPFVRRGLDADDLMQEGRLGFLRALRTFDPTRGFKLGTYATNWIHSYASRWRKRQGTVRVPEVRHRDNPEDTKALRPHMAALREAARLALRHKAFVSVDVAARKYANGEESRLTVGDMLRAPHDPETEHAETSRAARVKLLVASALATLTDRQRLVIQALWFSREEPSLKDVGDAMGLTRERIRQIEGDALFRMWEALRADGDNFEDWLDTAAVAVEVQVKRRGKAVQTAERKAATVRLRAGTGQAAT